MIPPNGVVWNPWFGGVWVAPEQRRVTVVVHRRRHRRRKKGVRNFGTTIVPSGTTTTTTTTATTAALVDEQSVKEFPSPTLGRYHLRRRSPCGGGCRGGSWGRRGVFVVGRRFLILGRVVVIVVHGQGSPSRPAETQHLWWWLLGLDDMGLAVACGSQSCRCCRATQFFV